MIKRVGRIKHSIKIKTNNIADLESHIANLKVELQSQRDSLFTLEIALEGAVEDLVGYVGMSTWKSAPYPPSAGS